ncbi:MAG: hypothetical protein V3U87_04455 [Methylococcaceae bacterium]
MDQVLEVISFYLTEWQQIAIDNTLYSVVLAALALLIGSFISGLIVAFLKQFKIGRLRREVRQGKKQLDVAEKSNDELLSQQKNDAVQLADFQQQLGQATKNLQHERNAHQSLVSEKDVLFLNTAKKKQEEVVAVNTMLEEKTILASQLQSNLTEQESKLSQYEETQVKIVEMEKKMSLSAIELKTAKQQLETELNTKNKQIEESTKIQKDRVSELELELKKINDKSEAEKIQQPAIKFEGDKNQILQEKQKPEQGPKAVGSLENVVKTDQQQNFQANIPRVVKQQGHNKSSERDVTIAEEKSQIEENITSEKNHAEPLKQNVTSIKKPNTEKQGVVDQAMGWFSSIDKVFEKKKAVEKKVTPVQKVEIESKPIDRVFDVELSKISVTDADADETEKIQQTINQQSEKNQIQEENQQSETKSDDPLINVEKNLLQENSQAAISSKKRHVQEHHSELLKQEIPLVNKKIPVQENQVEPVKQKVTPAKESNAKKQGVVGQVLGWFSSMDNAIEDEIIEKNEKFIQKVEIRRKSEIKETPNSVTTKIVDDEESSFSEKLADVADTMDSFSGKFKNLYRKVRK